MSHYGDQPRSLSVTIERDDETIYERTIELNGNGGEATAPPDEALIVLSEHTDGTNGAFTVTVRIDGEDEGLRAGAGFLGELLESCSILTVSVDRYDTPLAFGRSCE